MGEHSKAAWFRGRALAAIRLALSATDVRIKRLAKVLTNDEARRIAINVALLSELVAKAGRD
jgi:hypothetical protein